MDELSELGLPLKIDNEFNQNDLGNGWMPVTKLDMPTGETPPDEKGKSIRFETGEERFVLIRKMPGDGKIDNYPEDTESIKNLYLGDLHSEENGMTWAAKCSMDHFKTGFSRRNDVVFLGTCSKDDVGHFDKTPEKIWEQEFEDTAEGSFEIYLAATTNINPESKTMFVTICYSKEAITRLWNQIRNAAESIVSTENRLFNKKTSTGNSQNA